MREFENLTSMQSTHEFIRRHPLAFLYISRSDCSVCHAVYPQVRRLLEKYPGIQPAAIDAQEVKEVAGALSIFTVPVLLLFVEGKEYIREARIVHMDLLAAKIQKIYEMANG